MHSCTAFDAHGLQFPLALLEGVLTTHEPPSAGASGHSVAAPVPFPYIQFTAGLSPSDTAISHATSSSGGASNRLQFRCSVSYRPDTAVIVGQESQQHGQPAQGQQQEHPKTKRQRRQHEQLQLLRLQGPEPPVTFFFCSHDGACSVRATALGFCCPFPSCRGLRCWGWAALQQHVTASHSYLSCYFPDLVPGRQLEVFVRCQPGEQARRHTCLAFSAWSFMLSPLRLVEPGCSGIGSLLDLPPASALRFSSPRSECSMV